MKIDISWNVYSFSELSPSILYEILHLRSKVFIVEQADCYLDVDYKDQEAQHLVGMVDGKIVAYSRFFRSSEEVANFGRVLIAQEYRKYGFGKELVKEVLGALKTESVILISAQLYLKGFYESFGFVAEGESYLDGTIEHIDMYLRE